MHGQDLTDDTMAKALLEQYGSMMNYADLAALLKRTEGGLRYSMSRGKAPYVRHLKKARVRIGRRVYFKTHLVVEMLNSGTACED